MPSVVATVIPPETTALCTVSELKRELGLVDLEDDAVLAAAIEQASRWIEDYCGRVFYRETVAEALPGSGEQLLVLSRRPIVSVSTVELLPSGDLVEGWEVADPEAGLLWREGGWPAEVPAVVGATIVPLATSAGRLRYRVTYRAGYALPGDADQTPPVLPVSLRRAALVLARAFYLGRERDPSVTGEALGDYRVTVQPGAALAEVERMLAPYRAAA